MRIWGTGDYAAMLGQRFELVCRRLGLNDRQHRLDTTLFHHPNTQLALL